MGVVVPCPWCGSLDVTWRVNAFSRVGHMHCVECEARAPAFTTPDRLDDKATEAAALQSWNQRS